MPSNSCTVKPVNDLKSSGFLDNRSYESKEGTNQSTMDHKAVFKLIMQEIIDYCLLRICNHNRDTDSFGCVCYTHQEKDNLEKERGIFLKSVFLLF